MSGRWDAVHGRPHRIAAVAVVIPVHDEEALLPRCLDAIAVSTETLHLHHPGVEVVTVVGLDRCQDRSSEVARSAGVVTLEVPVPGVGAARRAGVERAGRLLATARPDTVWIANTDADSVVPPDWLLHQVEAANLGARLVVGRVRPDPDDLTAAVQDAWRARHRSEDVSAHVHGANLGVRLDAYLAAGGFPDRPAHEDVALVRRLERIGLVAVPGPQVLTSGRREGRVPAGFSGYLRDLDATVSGGFDDPTPISCRRPGPPDRGSDDPPCRPARRPPA